MPIPDLSAVSEFQGALKRFFEALDQIYRYWTRSAMPETADQESPAGNAALQLAINHREGAFEARKDLAKLAPGIVSLVTPPPNQTALQFILAIGYDVERAWHLCRFIHCISPIEKEPDPEFARLQGEMHGLLKLRHDLWEAWRHIGHMIALETAAASDTQTTKSDNPRNVSPAKFKRSTERGEGREKLIGVLTKHHKYADGGCLNLDPIGNNELARQADVDQATASAFFKQQFQGHRKYRAACTDVAILTAALKLLNGEFAPYLLYGGKPAEEDERDEE